VVVIGFVSSLKFVSLLDAGAQSWAFSCSLSHL
jgi:hypothetical protein